MVGFRVLGGGVCVVSVGDGGGGGHEGVCHLVLALPQLPLRCRQLLTRFVCLPRFLSHQFLLLGGHLTAQL